MSIVASRAIHDAAISRAREISEAGPCYVVIASVGLNDVDIHVTDDKAMAEVHSLNHRKYQRWATTFFNGEKA